MLHTLYVSTDDNSLNSDFMCKNAPAQIFLTPDRPFFQRIKTKLPKALTRVQTAPSTLHRLFSSYLPSYRANIKNVIWMSGKIIPEGQRKKVQNDKLVQQHIQFSFIGINEPSPSLFPVFPYVKTSCLREGEMKRKSKGGRESPRFSRQ